MFLPRLRAAATLVLAAPLLGGLLVAGPATAAGEVAGGPSFAAPEPLPITVPGSFVATNAASNSAGSRSTASVPFWHNTTWFSYTPAQSERVSIRATSISPSGWDNTLEIWTAGGTLVTERDDAYGLDALVVATLTAGTQYRIGLGAYRVDGHGSVTLAFGNQVPDAPTGVSATVGDASAVISWTAPDAHGSPITAYTVQCQEDGGSWTDCGTVTGTPPVTTRTVTGLHNGAGHRFRVVATSNIGDSVPSAAAPATGSDPVVPRGASTTTVSAPGTVARFEGAPLTASVTGSGGTVGAGTVTFSEGSTVLGVAPVVAGSATLDVDLTVGAHTVTADFGGTAAITASSGTGVLTVTKAAQSIAFTAPAAISTGSTQELTATASSGRTVTYTAGGTCTVAGARLTAVALGTCTITAAQAGSADYLAAPDVVRTVPVIELVGLELELEAPLEARAAGAAVTASGTGLLPSSAVALELHSTPRILATGVVSGTGTVRLAGVLPQDIESGAHELVLVGTAADGSVARTVLPLTVSSGGGLTRIGDALAAEKRAGQALALTGAPVAQVVAWGVGLLASGGSVVVAARRRDRTRTG